MDFLKKLAASLGLPETATEEQVLAAAAAARQGTVALQAALDPIATVAGVAAGSDAAAVLAGVQALTVRTGDAAVITALQSELATIGNELKTVRETTSREKATSFIDGEIVRGRVGVKPLRDHYISMHMADPARVEKELNALPVLTGTTLEVALQAADKDGNLPLTAEQRTAAALMGVDPKSYAATLKAEREAAL